MMSLDLSRVNLVTVIRFILLRFGIVYSNWQASDGFLQNCLFISLVNFIIPSDL